MFAQPKRKKNKIISDKKEHRNSGFLFNIVFMGYKRFLLFDEDYYSKLKIIDLLQNCYKYLIIN